MRENVGFKNPTYNAVFSDGLILLRNKDRVRRFGATHPALAVKGRLKSGKSGFQTASYMAETACVAAPHTLYWPQEAV